MFPSSQIPSGSFPHEAFDGLFNKQLVMIDGRSVYSPLYGGVYWADIDYVLEDIDRIKCFADRELALWGGNAVNGVVNIITKSAKRLKEPCSGWMGRRWRLRCTIVPTYGLQWSDDVSARAFYKGVSFKMTERNRTLTGLLRRPRCVTQSDDDSDAWAFRLGGERLTYSQIGIR